MEAKRFAALCLELDYGAIEKLEVQVPYPIVINGTLIAKYLADFRYLRNGLQIVEDVKPKVFRTDVYLLKKKLVEAIYQITITEVAAI